MHADDLKLCAMICDEEATNTLLKWAENIKHSNNVLYLPVSDYCPKTPVMSFT